MYVSRKDWRCLINIFQKIIYGIRSRQEQWKVPAIKIDPNIDNLDETLINFEDTHIYVAFSESGKDGVLMTVWDDKTEYSFLLSNKMLKQIDKIRKQS